MDPDVNLYFYGFVIASFSFGQMLASPAFGYWSQRTRSTKYPVVFGMLITSVGNALYALLPNIGGAKSKWFMLVARFFVGIGSGM
jgi:ceroid-lipofuscinosis MFS transporter 7